MDKSYVVVIGTGVTSRANLEALIEDYFYAKGKDVYLALAFDKVPSQGQIFAAQYARDNSKEIVIFCQEGANLQPFPSSSVSVTDTPIKDAIDLTDSTVMLLWDDSDPLCLEASNYCNSIHRRSYNLCEGLSLITRETSITLETDKPVIEDKTDNVVIPDTSVETGSLASLKAEIKKEVLTAVIASLQDALKKA
jgi:hypothetical protein